MLEFEDKFRSLSGAHADEMFAAFGSEQCFLQALSEYLSASGQSIHQLVDPGSSLRLPLNFDIKDEKEHFRWFFHFHSEADRNTRAGGHFHLFASPDYFSDYLGVLQTHIIAVELDADGDLEGFFVPNQWVTNEQMRPKSLLAPALADFDARIGKVHDLVGYWLAALTRFFHAEIEYVLQQRDEFLQAMARGAREEYFSNEQIERICEWKIS
jgi:hypothetical protein